MCCCEKKDPKQEALEALLAKYKSQKGALIPVLQQTQDIYGYLPKEALQQISRELKIPLSEIFGVCTFYAQFHLSPRGRNIIRVCLGTACHVRGGAKIFERVQQELGIKDGETTEDLRFTIESVACIGACGLAPVIMVNDDTHGRLTPDQIPDILAQYE
ncbi:NADH-quinone oxidoreductase subunit NuoE [Thermincola potens]|uniref:NADH-quinone oxidoreductase, E subunit n=1 Tax=Thermincola potens (strain JR) TaxID=635013 RepID=D5XCI1_THEPJ|nr:NADH-quinone oxidoreductase subunit NuoE [Thermincola potens]ADG81607.1 NADH-quinone oxidoreductase, E subunit [Thermincola potens JR]